MPRDASTNLPLGIESGTINLVSSPATDAHMSCVVGSLRH
jgi:hypothetical protein